MRSPNSFLTTSGFVLATMAIIGGGMVAYRGVQRYSYKLESINQGQRATIEQLQRDAGHLNLAPSKFNEEREIDADGTLQTMGQLAIGGGVVGLLLGTGVFLLLKREVSRRCRSEEALQSEQRVMRELINQIPEAIYIKDASGRYRIANRAYRKYLVADEKAPLENKTVFDFVETPVAEMQDREDQAVIRARRPSADGIERIGLREGENRWFINTKVPLLNSRGECTDLVGIYHEVTASRQMREELRQTKQALELANRAKSDFLANMSHEIRTPMNGVLGMIELALDTELTSQQREYLSLCKNSSQSLLDLLNDILDYSRGEAGDLTLENIPFDLHEIVSQVIDPLTAGANEKRISLSWNAAEAAPRWLRGDPARLRQVLVNLVGNAIKFTDSGQVGLEITVESGTRDEASLQFSVWDTGMGVAEARREEIFEAFSQGDVSHTRRFGGIGLGLTIASRLVRLMGGRIWLESTIGAGSTFHFTALFGVCETIPAPEAIRANSASLSGLSVLVVDPDLTGRRLLEDILLGWQMRPKLFTAGKAALTELRAAFRDANPFPLVLMDARMPDMEGRELARLIKSQPELQGTRLVLLSSVPELANGERAHSLGFDAALPKPVHPAELLEVISRIFSNPSAPAEPIRPDATVVKTASGAPAATFQPASFGPEKGSDSPNVPTPLRVLVAEDNPVNQAVAVAILSKRRHHIVCAKNGVEAVAVHAREPLDLILMDIQMPEMDGYAAVWHIRKAESESGRHIPIVAVTAHAMKGDRERCLSAGMDAYISKPYAKEELVRLVESFEAQPDEMAPKSVPDSVQGEAQATPAASNSPAPEKRMVVSERKQLISELGDEALVISLIGIFLEQVPKLLGDLDLAFVSGNASVVDRTAHTLKGSVGNFGATEAFRLAEAVEDAAKVCDLVSAADSAKKLHEEMKLVTAALTEMRG